MAKLELLVSSPGTGKTTYCIDLFRQEILKSPAGIDSRSYFVLPNREHAGRIQNLILKKGVPGLFNVHILTIQELGKRLLSGAELPRPGESMRRSVLRHIVEDPSEKWEYFAPVKDLPGFYELLSERIQEFRQATLTVDAFEKRVKQAGKDPVFRMKAIDFTRLMRRYEDELATRGFAEEVLGEKTIRFSGEAPLVILDGFYHFTRAQRTLIEALAVGGARMLATLTLPQAHEKRSHVFELVQNTRKFLEDVGFKPSKAVLDKNHRVGDPALLHLERSLFLQRPGKLTGKQDSVKLLTAETVHDESEAIAHEIRRLHRDTAWHYSDMAVILRSVQGYEKSIIAVFEEYGIPVSVHERRKTLETGLGRFVHRLLALFLSDWQQVDLFSLIKSGYAAFRPPPEAVSVFERAAFSQNVRSGREAWAMLAEGPVKPALSALAELEKKLMGARTARIFRLAFNFFLRACPLDLATGDGAAARTLENLLARAESLYAGKSGPDYSAVRFAEEFQRAIEAGLFSERPAGKNRVQVYDAVMALPKEYRVVFVAGLLDQRFPQPVNEDPFFKDEERALLNGKEPLLELRASRRSGERYFFYMAVTRARNLLYLSHPQKDRDGKPYLPSAFLDDVRRCFTELPLLEKTPGAPSAPALWVAEHEAEKAAAESLFARKPALSKNETKQVLAYAAQKRKGRRFERILEAGFHEETANLKNAQILETIREEVRDFSPSRLEKFLTCAFKHHAHYSLNLKPYLEDRIKAETGTMLHTVLEKYHSEKRTEAQLFKDLELEFKKSPLAAEPSYRRFYLLEQARRTLTLFLRYEKKAAKNGFEPKYFELSFGKKHDGSNAQWPHLKIGKEKVLVSGSIDRVDVSPDGKRALVIDYKLSPRDLSKKLKEGLEVQLPLYSLVVRDVLKLEPEAAELHFLKNGEKSQTLEGERLKELLGQTEQRVIDAAKRIREGEIAIRSKSCDHCNFATVCRYETWKLVYAEADRV